MKSLDRVADVGFGISVSGLMWQTIIQATDVATFILLIVSILSGIASGIYYIIKIRDRLKNGPKP